MDGEAGERFTGPVSIDLVADLQAGVLDEPTAARLRRRARTDPEVAAQLATLDRVRRELSALGSGAAAGGEVPAEVIAKVGSALRTQPAGARWRVIAAAVGLVAIVAAAVLGTTTLVDDRPGAQPVPSVPAAAPLPLTDREILALLRRPPDLGELADPQRLNACLGALGYATRTRVLGARRVTVLGQQGVLMVLPGDAPGRFVALAVAPNCNSADTGLLLSSVVARP